MICRRINHKCLYLFRGFIAFVAFTDFGSSIKAFVEKKCVFNEFSNQDVSTIPRIYGIFLILKAVILVYCTLFIHYQPLVSLGSCSLFFFLMLYSMELFLSESVVWNFQISFPCILNGFAFIGLIFTFVTQQWESKTVKEIELEEFKVNFATIKRKQRKKIV